MRRSLAVGCALIGLIMGSIAAANAADDAKAPTTLIQAWLAFPRLATVAWPYAYIRARDTNASEAARRQALFKEFASLLWRLKDDGYPKLAAAVKAWRRRLRQTHGYRVPGAWTPAWLMAHPHQNPPLARIQALGACQAPRWVQVWDAAGVRDVPWRAGLKLSHLLDIAPQLRGDRTDEVAVVAPDGHIDHYGIGAWNFADTELIPGTRVVAALPLQGEAFPWMRDAIAALLAHSPDGEHCREIAIGGQASRG